MKLLPGELEEAARRLVKFQTKEDYDSCDDDTKQMIKRRVRDLARTIREKRNDTRVAAFMRWMEDPNLGRQLRGETL